MKNKLFKLVATVMSVVILCSSFAVMSFAGQIVEHYAPEIDGYEAYYYLSNEKNTIKCFEFINYNEYDDKYFYTTNGYSYFEVDFSSVAPECDDYEVVFARTDGDKFIFYLYFFDLRDVYDEELEGYYEEPFLIDSFFVSTEDFRNFEKHYVTTNDDVVQAEYWRMYDYDNGFMCYVNDEWVFIDGDYVPTYEDDFTTKGKSVFYTTKDFVTWETHYTHETTIYSEDFNLYYEFTYDNNLLICCEDGSYIFAEDKLCGPFLSSYYDYEGDGSYSFYASYSAENNTLIRFEEIYPEDYFTDEDSLASLKVVSVNAQTGDETVIYDGEMDFFYTVDYLFDTVYVTVWDYDEDEYVMYAIDSSNNFKEVTVDSVDMDALICYYEGGSQLYMCYEDEIRVFDKSLDDYYTVTLSDKSYWQGAEKKTLVFDYAMYAFQIGKQFVILEAIGEDTVIYEVQGADVIKVGDVNRDLKINSSDALTILQVATGIVESTPDVVSKADCTKDGRVTSQDALMVLQYSTGLVSKI